MAQSQLATSSAKPNSVVPTRTPTTLRPRHRYSNELRAVLRIIEADDFLVRNVLPFIDCERESIDWDRIFSMSFGSGHYAAVTAAYGIWTDHVREGCDPFNMAFSLGPKLQLAVLSALAIRWGLASDVAINPQVVVK
jgi:hypothetical protein